MSTYEYSPSTAKAFALDEKISLPRFQRKITWDASRDFVLAISVFKGYPLGVVVINETSSGEVGLVKWLLDGRQRRTAFIQMLENPENIYDWSRKFLKIKKTHTESEIIALYWSKIQDQLGTDADLVGELAATEANPEGVEDLDVVSGSGEELRESVPGDMVATSASISSSDKTMGHLEELLQIILSVHPRTPTASNYTRPFYFKKLAKHLDYVEGKSMNGNVLTSLLSSYIKKYPLASEWSNENFSDFLCAEYRFKKLEDAPVKIKNAKDAVAQNWSLIKPRISIVMKIGNRLEVAKIGLVSLRDAGNRDAQYTFKIINTQGVPLSSAEVSSADPHWNVKVPKPTPRLVARSREFYQSIGIKSPEGIVRWDSPATLFYALGTVDGFSLFNNSTPMGTSKSAAEAEGDINYGFKLLSAIKLKSVNRSEVSELPKLKDIDWGHVADELVDDFGGICKSLLEHEYFAAMKNWGLSLKARFGDTPSICVATLLYNDWCRKEKPTTKNSKKANQFIKNAFFEFDRLAFEAIYKKWKSASDTVLSDKLKRFVPEGADLVDTINESEWKQLLEDMFDRHLVGGVFIGDRTLDPVFEIFLAHFTCVMNTQLAVQDNKAEFSIDHVIPVSVFEASPRKIDGVRFGNLVPIPKQLNSIKNNRPVNKMSDSEVQRYAHYSRISQAQLRQFSDCNHFGDLSKMLREIYISKFLEKRREMINS
jgi:hypothetical protein